MEDDRTMRTFIVKAGKNFRTNDLLSSCPWSSNINTAMLFSSRERAEASIIEDERFTKCTLSPNYKQILRPKGLSRIFSTQLIDGITWTVINIYEIIPTSAIGLTSFLLTTSYDLEHVSSIPITPLFEKSYSEMKELQSQKRAEVDKDMKRLASLQRVINHLQRHVDDLSSKYDSSNWNKTKREYCKRFEDCDFVGVISEDKNFIKYAAKLLDDTISVQSSVEKQESCRGCVENINITNFQNILGEEK